KSVYCAYISANLQFRKFFFATLIGTLASAAVGIGMALNGFGAWSLVAQQVTNTVIDTLILVIITRIGLVFRISVKKLGSLFSYGWKVFVSSLLTTAYSEAVPLFIGIRFTSSDLSFYTKGKLFPSTVSNTTTSTLSAVLFPVLSRFQDDREKLLSATRRFISVTSYVVFPIMLGFFAIADNFVIVLLTDKWADAIYYLRIFCIASMFDMIHSGNCETIKAMGRSDIFLIMEIIKKSTYFAVIAAFLFLGNTPQTLSVAAIVCTGIALTVNSFPNRKLIGYSLKQQAADIVPNLLISVLMCACVMCIGLIPLGRTALLAIQVVSGALIYLALSLLTKNRNLDYLIGVIREKRDADVLKEGSSGDTGNVDDE
ncbi:MAG: oligosaccharide flippase family protein, partial [Clostridia bacterium]|nr:oligosaccharide flippase family protein [Clostridia bacterium]